MSNIFMQLFFSFLISTECIASMSNTDFAEKQDSNQYPATAHGNYQQRNDVSDLSIQSARKIVEPEIKLKQAIESLEECVREKMIEEYKLRRPEICANVTMKSQIENSIKNWGIREESLMNEIKSLKKILNLESK